MTDNYWNEMIGELESGAQNTSHPFRLATLATIGLEQVPRLRTVVIRAFDPESLQFTFYTDSRSKKMLHIKENNKVSLLFYNPEKLIQLRIEGLAIKERNTEVLVHHWEGVQDQSRKVYTTALTPGSEITQPDKIEYLERDDYFTVVNILPFRIEYLQLKVPSHIRIRFSKEGSKWRSDFLVP